MASSGSFSTSNYQGRYLTFSWSVSSQSIANNQTTISWSLKGGGTASSSWYYSGNFKVVIDGSTVYSSSTRIKLYDGTEVASGNYTMTHNSSGNKSFSASAEAGIYTVAVNCSGSSSWDLPQIPRQATITNAPNFNDEQNPTITYSNPAGNNVTTLQACISLTGSSADISYRDISKTGTSYTFNLTTAERNVLRQATTGKTRTVIFYIKTVIGGNTFYSTASKTLTITNANPTIGSIDYLDTNSTTTNITGNNHIIIQNKSVLLLGFGTLSAKKYATLSKVEVTINGITKSTNLSGTSAESVTLNFGTVNVSSNTTASIVITDSRSYTTTYSKTITIIPWSLPTAIITCQRKNNYYSATDINVNADYSSLNGNNQLTIQYQYKKTTDSSYSALATLQDNVTTTFTIDNLYAWNVKVIVSDLLGSTTYNLFVDKGIPLIFFDRSKSSTGINCFPVNNDSLEVKGEDIYKALFYSAGDSESLVLNGSSTNRMILSGMLTNSAKEFWFSIPLPKSMKNVTPSLSVLKVNVRKANGGYLLSSGIVSGGYDVLNDSNMTVTAVKSFGNMLTIEVAATNEWRDVSNNTPVVVTVENVQIDFN